MVNITSRKPHINQDLTVVLNPGDHPYIAGESVVNYADARFVDNVGLIETSFIMNVGVPQEPCSEALLKLLCKGLLISKHTKEEIIAYFKSRILKA